MKQLRVFFAVATAAAAHNIDSWPSREQDHSKLQIVFPHSLTKKNGYAHKDALFGYPSYALGSLQTQLILSNSTACQELDTLSDWERPFALLIDRGDCHFVVKVRNAQHRGASAVIIADNKCLCSDAECMEETGDTVCEKYLPFMADDDSGGDITIPSMLIRKSDADSIKRAIAHAEGVSNVMIKFDWGIPSPDGRVEWDLWQSSWDEHSMGILDNLEPMVAAFGARAFHTPHFVSYNGSKVGCHSKNGENACGNMCLNRGRYCLLDPSPSHDQDTGASGADVVVENLRRLCLWHFASKKEPGIASNWWKYVKESDSLCGQNEKLFRQKSCTDKIMNKYGFDPVQVEKCMQPYGMNVDETNPILDKELQKQAELELLRLPALYVDGVHARGKIDPASVFSMICAGFGTHNPPEICSCAQQPTTSLVECIKVGGVSNAVLVAGNGGLTFGSIAFITLFVFATVSAAGYVYWRRTQQHMRDQVRSILAEYMPLEEQGLLDEESPRRHPAEVAAAQSPRGYLPSREYLRDDDEL